MVESGVDFVPMIYGNCCGLDQLPDGLPENTTVLLGFNEPNHMEESNLTPEAAAQLWPRLQAAAEKLGARLGSPAAAVCGAYCNVRNPFDWWEQFFGNCSDCRVDFIATHYYTCSPQYLQWFLNDIWDRYQRPIWLTELACPNENGTLSRQVTYMRNALKVLDEDDAVERYAWFAPHTEDFGWIGPTASLFLPDADPPELSALGRVYAGYAVPEAVVTDGSAALSAADVAALTQPLTAVDKAGSWLAACGACVSGDSAVESALTGIDAHCRDCGILPRERGQSVVQGAAHGLLKGHVGDRA
ncbi:probable alkali-sensitive linkage protein 1 [Coccomyxa sp. Obi]|nr:probable alkali-sensitive linkage protein 1 [Coccomyxa sp. Obi]